MVAVIPGVMTGVGAHALLGNIHALLVQHVWMHIIQEARMDLCQLPSCLVVFRT